MENSTPKLINVDEFNSSVRIWAISTKRKIAQNAPVVSGKLLRSLSHKINKFNGESSRVRYNFDPHGIYVHYGVGRGYIRVGNELVRGRRLKDYEKNSLMKRCDSKRDVNKLRVVYNNSEITQSYYGDKAMQKLLTRIDKITINKKR
jgi:hypothetical protein